MYEIPGNGSKSFDPRFAEYEAELFVAALVDVNMGELSSRSNHDGAVSNFPVNPQA